MSTTEEWISGVVSHQILSWAKEKRRVRDLSYGVRYDIEPWHMRYLGEAGERCFNGWLDRLHVPHTWIDDNPATSPDFIVRGISVDVKVSSRNVPARPEWNQSITAERAHEPYIDWFFLATYHIPARRLSLMGAISRESVISLGRFCPGGTAIHSHYTVAEGHEVYSVEYRDLIGPLRWIGQISP